MHDEAWVDYIAGRTVAVVGPAPAPYDQSDEVDAHDVVIRTGFTGHVPDGYGTRTDVAFYNVRVGNEMMTGVWDEHLAGLDWILFKSPRATTDVAPWRHVPRLPGVFANQIPLILGDLVRAQPRAVSVFGANFYLAPHDDIYNDGYQWGSEFHAAMRAVAEHQQVDQRRCVRDLMGQLNVVGDRRFLEVALMDDDDYMRAMNKLWPGLFPEVIPPDDLTPFAADEPVTFRHPNGWTRTVRAGSQRARRMARDPDWKLTTEATDAA